MIKSKTAIVALIVSLCIPVIPAVSARDDNFVYDNEPSRTEVLIRYHGSKSILALPLPGNADLDSALVMLKNDPRIDIAEKNSFVRATALPNDPLFSKQTFLQQIQAPAAWDVTTGSRSAVVAILDSGLDTNHPDIRNNVWRNGGEIPGDGVDNDNNGYIDDVNGWDFVNDIPDATPKFGGAFTDAGIHHGTVIAGIIAAEGNNGIGVSGVSWHTNILPLRVLNNRGEGDILTVIRAIEYAINARVAVMNLSFVGETDSTLLRDALKRASDAGIVVVAASGNDEQHRQGVNLTERPLFPACYANAQDFTLVSVASVTGEGTRAPYSNYGNCITISAPGNDITTTQVVRYEQPGFDAFYGKGWSGTSLSTGVVSGVVALLKSINPAATPAEIVSLLKSTCSPIDAINPDFMGKLGCGTVNASASVHEMMRMAQEAGTVLMGEIDTPEAQIAVSTLDGKMPLRLFSKDGVRDESYSLLPFDPYRISYSVAAGPKGDLIVFGAGRGGGPQVRIFTRDFKLVGQFFAYDKGFRGGVNVAMGDVDGDGADDIVTVPGPGGGPQVRVFDTEGNLKRQFFAYDASFRGGLRIALGDMNGNGASDLVVTPQRAKTEVRVYTSEGNLMTRFEPYPRMNVPSVMLAVGDVDGDGISDIVTSPASGAAAVRIFSAIGQLKKQIIPYDSRFRGGIALAVGDVNADHADDIVVGPLSGGGPHVRMFSGAGSLLGQFFPLPKTVRRGLTLSIVP